MENQELNDRIKTEKFLFDKKSIKNLKNSHLKFFNQKIIIRKTSYNQLKLV